MGRSRRAAVIQVRGSVCRPTTRNFAGAKKMLSRERRVFRRCAARRERKLFTASPSFWAVSAEAAGTLRRLTPPPGVARRLVPSGGTIFFLLKAGVIGFVLTFLVLASVMLWALYDTPPERQAAIQGPSLLVEAANGEPIGRVGPFSTMSVRRQFSRHAHQGRNHHRRPALLQPSRRRPWRHRTCTLRELVRREIVEGGSTITQQLAKMQIVGHERSSAARFARRPRSGWSSVSARRKC